MEVITWFFLALTLILTMFTKPSSSSSNENLPPVVDPITQKKELEKMDFEDVEWHMDYMPTGYLPDSVYRELAWYGILQLQPLHHSSKHLAVAQLIWQHTLGRPHVIMESPPQSAQSPPKPNRQVVAEEGSKWSRDQRTHQEVVMENIKNGLGGLTVRTVISRKKVTTLIIKDAVAYKCDSQSQPDYEGFRERTKAEEKLPKCINMAGTDVSEPDPVDDICIEGESAPLEYSVGEGWLFCFGSRPRETTYDDKGKVDCGDKTKTMLQTFYEDCAIDNNVVITFDYFAGEPRKEVMQNSTLCSVWDPCHLSYLYRIEPPEDAPPAPFTTESAPCETTMCDDCRVTDVDDSKQEQAKYEVTVTFVTMTSGTWLVFASVISLLLIKTSPLAEDPTTPSQAMDFEDDEWHMDFMPTGYLPDSVYRDLAWYGILQLQPLHHSTKHLAVAQLIWQHTLGRPHVIMENPPQSANTPPKINRQAIAEEATKWSRDQRSHQEVVMENIKSGMGGLTVRTVISHTRVSNYIIKDGLVYECEKDYQPDYDDYRGGENLHLSIPICISNADGETQKGAVLVNEDPCVEGETAPLEYSVGEGWVFCFGNRVRESSYSENGTVDCGQKTKKTIKDFLDECAIDNNVVITFDYFASEPRKEVLHNSTLCTIWDPCHLSYLYRLEPPDDIPQPPLSTAPSPCDTTVCEECKVSGTEEQGVPPGTTSVSPNPDKM